MTDLAEFKKLVKNSSYPVFFTGAGISTDSGIPDFRGPNGFWKKNTPIYFQDFMSSNDMRKQYWEQSVNFKSNFSQFRPNKGHDAIAKIINSKKHGHCVTQNVDNLHQAAGLEDNQVTEIHGNATYAVCLSCEKKYELETIHQAFKENQKPPNCQDCKGFIKTATISFGQPMPQKEMMRAQYEATNCDLMVAVGSSLVVYPAATIPLLGKQSGAKFVILNNEPTEMDEFADLVINANISETFDTIL
tara:strand:+ start:62 stop:799 length:738 start_codon:yes stop_codon:yes gene_type:complete